MVGCGESRVPPAAHGVWEVGWRGQWLRGWVWSKIDTNLIDEKAALLSELQFLICEMELMRIWYSRHWMLLRMKWEKPLKHLAQCWAHSKSSIKVRWCWLESLSSEHGKNSPSGMALPPSLSQHPCLGGQWSSGCSFVSVGLVDYIMLQMHPKKKKKKCAIWYFIQIIRGETLGSHSLKTKAIEEFVLSLEFWLRKLTSVCLKLNAEPSSPEAKRYPWQLTYLSCFQHHEP